MHMSQTGNLSHATASPGSDAPGAGPAAWVKVKQAGTLNIRTKMHIACWNVRTLLNVGSQSVTMCSLHEYRVDIACLSEIRIPNHGNRRIPVPGADVSYWLYHSGPTDNSGLHGVGFALSDRANDALIAWKPVSPRIAVARFKGSPLNLTVIAIYAPTSSADPSVKDTFYEDLQEALNQTPRRDMLVIAGDWNARVGQQEEATRHIIGRFTLGQRCDNGERLMNFAALNHLVISNTRFQHPKKHLVTWYSNDGHTVAQIDHILVRTRWASTVEDCRAYRGAETGNPGGTDHTLLRARLKLHLACRRKRRPLRRINTGPLQHAEVQQALTEAIATQLCTSITDITCNQSRSVDEQWVMLKTAIQKASVEQLGYVEHRQKSWISDETIQL
jgi:exonuclease III